MVSGSLAERALRAVLARKAAQAAVAPPSTTTGTVADLALPPAAFADSGSSSRLPAPALGEFSPQHVSQLVRWPQMRLVAPERLAACARICALLAHTPSAGFLVHRRLGLPADEVMPLLHALHAEGCLRLAVRDSTAASVPANAVPSHEPPPTATIWGKLLKKLLS